MLSILCALVLNILYPCVKYRVSVCFVRLLSVLAYILTWCGGVRGIRAIKTFGINFPQAQETLIKTRVNQRSCSKEDLQGDEKQ